MKNHKLTAPSIAALIVAMLSTAVVSAQPTSSPTGGNVDAEFNSVDISDGSSVNFNVSSDGKVSNPGALNGGHFYVNDSLYLDRTAADGRDVSINGNVFGIQGGPGSPQFTFLSLIDAFGGIGSRQLGVDAIPLKILDDSGLAVGDAAGTIGFNIAANGDISDTSGAVTVNDNDGFSILGSPTVAQAFSVSGDSAGGYAIMRSDGTYYADVSTAPNTFKEAFRVTGGSWGANPDGTFRVMNDGEMMINLNAGAGVSRMAVQIDGNPSGTGLHIFNDGSISQDTISSGAAAGVRIDRNGVISNPGPSNSGKISMNDNEGLRIVDNGGTNGGSSIFDLNHDGLNFITYDNSNGATTVTHNLSDSNSGRLLRSTTTVFGDTSGSYLFMPAGGIMELGSTGGFHFGDYSNGGSGPVTFTPNLTINSSGGIDTLKNTTGIFLTAYGDEAAWYNNDHFSWGYGGNWNEFRRGVTIGSATPPGSDKLRVDGGVFINGHAKASGGFGAFVPQGIVSGSSTATDAYSYISTPSCPAGQLLVDCSIYGNLGSSNLGWEIIYLYHSGSNSCQFYGKNKGSSNSMNLQAVCWNPNA